MYPPTLRRRVQDHIESLIDQDAWASCDRAQGAEQDALQKYFDRWPDRGVA
ncbi:MAG TPA: hypothetical protein VJO33_06675 [Gemmatimonadaceae bacterium]|nr:hypothetical protein [Gemmatimonadaceae bacterium]